MKPLGYGLYYKGNKKTVIRYMATIMITVVILAIIQLIITNLGDEICKNDEIRNNIIAIKNDKSEIISEEIIKEIKAIKGVNTAIPKKSINSNFIAFASTPNSIIIMLNKDDINTYLKSINVKYNEDIINELGDNEVYLSHRVSKNSTLKKGDKIDTDYPYTYKHSLDTDLLIGVTPVDLSMGSDEYYIICDDNEIEKVNNKLKHISKDICVIDDDSGINELSYKYTLSTFNIVRMIVTITCATVTGVTTYLHYNNRKKEIGVLKALGYTDKKVIFRVTKEISISSLLSFILSIGLINLLVFSLNKYLMEPSGYLPFYFDISMLSGVIIVILSIMIFSIVPTWILLKSVDKISLIEGR